MYECRCDERLQTKTRKLLASLHWVDRGTGTPKDRDEVNNDKFPSTMGEYVTER